MEGPALGKTIDNFSPSIACIALTKKLGSQEEEKHIPSNMLWILFMCISDFPAHISVHHLHADCSQRWKEVIIFPGSGGYRCLWTTIWMLGLKHTSSETGTNALNKWAILPPFEVFFRLMKFSVIFVCFVWFNIWKISHIFQGFWHLHIILTWEKEWEHR